MSKNHGLLEPPKPTPQPEQFAIPLSLQRKLIISNLYGEEAIAKYGEWEMQAEEPFDHDTGFGGKKIRIEKGDIFRVAGNLAIDLAIHRTARFCDKRAVAEAQLLKQAEELGIPKNAKEIAAFTARTRPAKTWDPQAASRE